eukprot:CAMPEP_0201517690 /NCGR_PEP_ID=MMETSP0161_2-20130828/8739_1 /ASSEMBLY_ACC=CAM_ASM_000251 /TAXON_ID=180227 /ORGANISM="Neoparamoeba aestuarina, Strain SoJaBio B1-5/56/2" /LENGTH=344 /DNA_ID=CAMNT_0047915271 /DNA_START=170 /DNA_END=1201 /DNA_ORIENTATION=+
MTMGGREDRPEEEKRIRRGTIDWGTGVENQGEGVLYLDVEYKPPVKSGVECSDAVVTVTVKRCQDLTSRHPNGLVDPYVIIHYGDQSKRTRYLKKTVNPCYNLQYRLALQSDVKVINFEVWDWNRIGTDELIGQCSFTPSDLQSLPKVNSLSLELRKEREKKKEVSKKKIQPGRQVTQHINTTEIDLEEKRQKLGHLCELRKAEEDVERENREKNQVMKQIEVRTWSTPVPIHSSEDPVVVWFLGFLVAFCTINFLFHHFLWTLYAGTSLGAAPTAEELGIDAEQLEAVQENLEAVAENLGTVAEELGINAENLEVLSETVSSTMQDLAEDALHAAEEAAEGIM